MSDTYKVEVKILYTNFNFAFLTVSENGRVKITNSAFNIVNSYYFVALPLKRFFQKTDMKRTKDFSSLS